MSRPTLIPGASPSELIPAMPESVLHFLGTGGGRHAMATQKRKTAGIMLVHGSTQIHIDPGPGALVHSIYAGLTPLRLSGVVVTHCHPDHYNDAEVLVEAMTGGTTRKRGVLAAARSVLEGGENVDRSVSRYHQGLAARVETLVPGTKFEIGDVRFESFRSLHGDADAVSLRFTASGQGDVVYTSDTELYPGYEEHCRGLRLLILGTMWPRGSPLQGHLCTDDAARLISEVKPRCAITTHYGIKIINADPAKEAAWIEEETGVPTISATDGMSLTLSDKVTAKGPRKADEPRVIDA